MESTLHAPSVSQLTPLEEILKPLLDNAGCKEQYQKCLEEMRLVAKHFQNVHCAYQGAYEKLQIVEETFAKASEGIKK